MEQEFSRFEQSVKTNNKRAIKAGGVATLTTEEFEAAYIYFNGKCAYSGQSFADKANISIEHIIPIISGGHSMAFNCIPVNDKYNSSKSGYHLLDWWKSQKDGRGRSLYEPLRLVKILNYMIKCLESINQPDPMVHILKDNEIDAFLMKHTEGEKISFSNTISNNDFKKISQIEVLRKMDMIRIEDLYSTYSELDSIRLDTAIFFEEALHELEGVLPEDALQLIATKIRLIPDIYIDGKKVFKKEMKPEDVKIRQEVLDWTERENLENKYGIIGYLDFEVLKQQENIQEFLDTRKATILKQVGAMPFDFNNIVNKVPNILTNLHVERRILDISRRFNISTECIGKKSSEMYRYVLNKPDLLLAGENMDILLSYVEKYDIDKRLLKRGVPISTIIDNIEMAIELVNKAELGIQEDVKRRVLGKLINGTTGNLLRDAYRQFRKMVRRQNKDNPKSVDEEKRDAAKWIICISEKYNASEILKLRRISKTKGLYENMNFDNEGFLRGVNPNSYIVPKIIYLAGLDISKEAESELIRNVFSIDLIRQGRRADEILKELAINVRRDESNISDDEVMQLASKWFVFLSETPQLSLDVMFDSKRRNKYIELTKKCYKDMKFDDKGNFTKQDIPELSQAVSEEYMNIIDSFFKSTGQFYVIKGRYVPKEKIRDSLYEKVSTCKNKKAVRAICIRTLKELSENIDKCDGGDSIGE